MSQRGLGDRHQPDSTNWEQAMSPSQFQIPCSSPNNSKNSNSYYLGSVRRGRYHKVQGECSKKSSKMVEKPYSFKSTKYNLLSIKTLYDMILGYLPDLFSYQALFNTEIFALAIPSAKNAFPMLLTWLSPSLHSGVYSNVTSSEWPSLTNLFQIAHPPSFSSHSPSIPLPCFSFTALIIIQYYLYMCMYTFVYIYTHYQGRDFCLSCSSLHPQRRAGAQRIFVEQ